MLLSFSGDKNKLGTAEKFLIHLLSLPLYQTRIEGLLLKVIFKIKSQELLPNMRAILEAGEALLDNHSLKEFLRYALHAGNFINAVSLAYLSIIQHTIHGSQQAFLEFSPFHRARMQGMQWDSESTL